MPIFHPTFENPPTVCRIIILLNLNQFKKFKKLIIFWTFLYLWYEIYIFMIRFNFFMVIRKSMPIFNPICNFQPKSMFDWKVCLVLGSTKRWAVGKSHFAGGQWAVGSGQSMDVALLLLFHSVALLKITSHQGFDLKNKFRIMKEESKQFTIFALCAWGRIFQTKKQNDNVISHHNIYLPII